jgi:hypothetical protein
MVLEKDHQVLRKALDKDEVLTKQEQEYLIKLRTMYTPAQLQILEALVRGDKGGFNFAEFVVNHPDIIQMSRTDTITVAKSQDE